MIKYRYEGSHFKGQGQIPASVQVDLFRSMLRIRRIEEVIESRYHEDEMKSPIHLVIGQEASCVGSCMALRKQDFAYCGHRTHGVYLAKGGSLKGMLAELYCRSTGCAGSRGGSMHLFDKSVGMDGTSAICGGAVPIANGSALAAQLRNEDRVTAVFFGDGGSEEGVVWESLNFAALKKLPVLFVCENNFYSVCSPLDKRQPDVEIYKKAASFGVESYLVDGTNVLEVYEATRTAAERARSGKGPAFLEIVCYRWRAHGGSGDDSKSGYRDLDEVADWQKLDPIELHYQNLLKAGMIHENDRAVMEKEISTEIEEAFQYAISSPVPDEKDLYRFVYAD